MNRPFPTSPAPAPWRALALTVCAAAALGAAAGRLPLLEVPGYELSELSALLAALFLAPILGLGAARRARARPAPSVLSAWGSASVRCAAVLAALLAGSALRAAAGPCHALRDAAFFPLLALPSALLGCALAVALGFATGGRRALAGLLYAAAALALLSLRLLQAYRGPAAFLLDPLLGYFPGPLYDETVPLDARLLLSRGEAVGWALLAAGLAAAFSRLRRGAGAGDGGRAATATAALGACLLAATWLPRLALQGGPDLREGLIRALGARREGPRCTVFLPAEEPRAVADELLAECEFHVADVAARLGVQRPPRVTVFVHRSPAEKRRWVGAAQTDFTKPWLAEVHVDDQPLPHPVLRHEIVHAVASALAPGPLHVPARAWVVPSLTLIEGLAVALETPRSGYTVHQWSRAARDLGLLPDLSRLLGPAGFWGEAPARAYVAAGSFLAHLLDRYGPGPVAAAYRTGDLAGAFGRPLPTLVEEWQRSLDAVAPSEELARAASRWLGRGSLFERRCAREAAELEQEAAAAAARGRTAEACGLWAQEAEVGEPAPALLRRGEALAASGDLPAAAEAYRAAAERLGPGEQGLAGRLHAAEGDLRWRRGDVAGAAAEWAEASRATDDRGQARLLAAKQLAAPDPELGPAARAYLLDPGDPLALVKVARSRAPLAAYLVGRALLGRGARAQAAPELARAAAADLPAPLSLEARLLLAEARCDPADAGLLAPLERAGDADRARLEEARRRCAFEAGAGRAAAR
ncbi:MAG TPA: type VI secretion system protein [Anaeromyxobacter sp.]|nr:type VI secretion system protein [Anaeromyxobacter sp.]